MKVIDALLMAESETEMISFIGKGNIEASPT
jgi:hypothetical protein